MKNALFVQPAYPISNKSRNHKNYFPIGLLKLATHYRRNGFHVELVHGLRRPKREPTVVLVTSLFTYWSSYVHEAVKHYRALYPKAKIVVGGIYASLMPEHCAKSGCDEVFVGLHKEAEKCPPDLRLARTDYQVLHASRGCLRRCEFCGVRLLEPEFAPKSTIKAEVKRRKLVFYDNNFLANPHIETILNELAAIRIQGRAVICESQSGFDARLITPRIAEMLKRAHFIYPRVAWDGGMAQKRIAQRAIKALLSAGYRPRDISVYMLYNHSLGFDILKRKVRACKAWGVQVADCRFRPLNSASDGYTPLSKNGQTREDYYIHPRWTDAQVRAFRRLVRRQNICIRHGFQAYSAELENEGKRLKKRTH